MIEGFLKHAGENFLFTALIILCSAGGLYFFWMFCRKVVKWGFFTGYFLFGAFFTLLLNPTGPALLPLSGGLAFAWAVLAIRNKVWRVVTPAILLLAAAFVFPGMMRGVEAAAKEVRKVDSKLQKDINRINLVNETPAKKPKPAPTKEASKPKER